MRQGAVLELQSIGGQHRRGLAVSGIGGRTATRGAVKDRRVRVDKRRVCITLYAFPSGLRNRFPEQRRVDDAILGSAETGTYTQCRCDMPAPVDEAVGVV